MKTYHVVWEIHIDASSSEFAAMEALKIMRDPDAKATVFHVTEFNPGVVIDGVNGEILDDD